MPRPIKYGQTPDDREPDRAEFVRDRLALPNFWEVYAEAKYQGRDLRGMRDVLNPPATLGSLSAMLVDLCECAWRSGVKPQDLMAAAKGELRRRRKSSEGLKGPDEIVAQHELRAQLIAALMTADGLDYADAERVVAAIEQRCPRCGAVLSGEDSCLTIWGPLELMR